MRAPSKRLLTGCAIALASWTFLVAGLAARSLWVDEYFSVAMTGGGPLDAAAAALSDFHPPLYFMALNLWRSAAGNSEFGLRALSSIGGILAVTLMGPVAARTHGRRWAIPAMLALAVAPAAIEFGRMARYYSWVMALGLLATWLMLRAIEAGPRATQIRRWAAYAVAGVFLAYTFYFGAALLIGHIAWILACRPAERATFVRVLAGWLGAIAVIGLCFAPWLITAVGRQVQSLAAGAGAELSRSAFGLLAGLGMSAYTFAVGETIFPWNPLAVAGLIAVAALVARAGPRGRALLAVAAIPILLLALATTTVATSTPFLNVPVRGLFALPYALLGLLAGFSRIEQGWARIAVGIAIGMAWLAGNINYALDQQLLNPIYNTPSRQAADLIALQARPGDLTLSEFDTVFGYYAARVGPLPYRELQPLSETTAALQSQRPPRLWLIVLGRDRTRDEDENRLRAALGAAYRAADPVCLAPIDPLYMRLKSAVLRRSTYDCRLSIERYDLVP